MILTKSQYNQLTALRRLILSEILQNGRLTPDLIEQLHSLGEDHGFDKDEVQGIIDDCSENLFQYQKYGYFE